MTSQNPYIAVTERKWFEFFSSRADSEPVDEVNFWSPNALRPFKTLEPGAPLFFRLGAPVNVIAGYGFEAHFDLLSFDAAWRAFEWNNGFEARLAFFEWGAKNRHLDLSGVATAKLACTIVREATFWPKERWIPWGLERGWARTGIQQGKYETDVNRVSHLMSEVANDRMGVPAPEEFAPSFVLLDADEREVVLAKGRRRCGQGTFRSRLLTAYGSRCAITGEHTEPVLDAAHVQPYLGPRSNHLQNGLLLTKEFHALFDEGLVTITPEYTIRVSRSIRDRWNNGHRYYPFDGKRLQILPGDLSERPCVASLKWHELNRFSA